YELFEVSRHEKAIPQYEAYSEERYEAISKIEAKYPGLILGGNMIGGIGMSDRIRQGYINAARIAEQVVQKL
ncbi:MAG: protoporphyrinogen oxidase, partial [Bacteroidales bacterium]